MPGNASYAMPAGQLQYALWADRVLGAVVDGFFVLGVMIALYFLLIVMSVTGGAISSAGAQSAGGVIGVSGCCLFFILPPLAQFVVGIYNTVYLVSNRGYSVGQGVMGLKVISEHGGTISFGTALTRLLARVGLMFIPIVGTFLDLLWPLWDIKRQTLHDKAVGVVVIKTK
jgi:uncharacterized RDD family membrane protein YckC